jgi:hypothetical protein
MDFDLFLTSPRWDILEIISKRPSSPIEIAEQLNTTVSYVSQQLKLLDAAGLITKEKTGAAEKGKPRSIFGLSNEFLYLSILTTGFSQKKLLNITQYHKVLLKIWFYCDPSLHHSFGKLFFKLDESINEVSSIYLETSFSPKLIVVTDSKKLKGIIDSFSSKISPRVAYSFLSKNQFDKLGKDNLVLLYDSDIQRSERRYDVEK